MAISLGEVGCPCIFIIYYDKAKVIGFPAFAVHNLAFSPRLSKITLLLSLQKLKIPFTAQKLWKL